MEFRGWIAGLGTTSGVRVVVGHWPTSPFGSFTDVMVERADGRRLLLAPSVDVAEFVAGTYGFDEVRVVPVTLRPAERRWELTAGPLDVAFEVGRRTVLGLLLRVVPPALGRRPAWVRLIGPAARLLLPGVRTHGSAGNDRYEWYGAHDLHPIVAASGRFDGDDLGRLADLTPPVRFGFGSTPRSPSVVRITTTVRVR